MRSSKEIIYKILVDNLHVSPELLSRVDGDDPVSIELTGGESIFINFSKNDGTIQTVLDIPFRDSRKIQLRSSGLFDLLMSIGEEEPVYLHLNKEKILLLSSQELDDKNFEKKVSDRLCFFNKIVNHLK